MRILHILDHSLPLHSGYTFRSRSILQIQAKHGWQPAVLTSPKHQESWKGKWDLQETVEGFPHFRTPPVALSSIPACYEIRLMSALKKRIREVISMHKPDVIHAHSPILNALPALSIGGQLGIPVVYEIRAFWEDAAVDHGSYRENSWKYRLVHMLETRICRRANHVTVLCNGLRQDLIRRGISAHKLSIAANGINIEEFQGCPPDKEISSIAELKKKSIVGFFGSFYRYEGLDLLIDAFALVARKHNDCGLLLVGGGEMETALKEKVQALGLTNCIAIPGRVPHERIPGIYALCDMLVYPRYSMRLTDLVTPLKPLEAMAMGKAVIASDVGGHKELIQDGETGVLFPAGNATMLASAIERLLLDKELRFSLARRAQIWVRQERSWEKTTAVYEDVYREVLSGPRA